MRFGKLLMAATAATLMSAPVLAQASAPAVERVGVSVGEENDALGAMGGLAAVGALAAVLVVAAVVADDDTPDSP